MPRMPAGSHSQTRWGMLYRLLVALLAITLDYLPVGQNHRNTSTFVCRAKCDQGPYTGRIWRLDSLNPPDDIRHTRTFPGYVGFVSRRPSWPFDHCRRKFPFSSCRGELPFRFGPPRRRGRVNHVQRSDCMLILHFNREKVLEDFPAMAQRSTPLSSLIWDILKDQVKHPRNHYTTRS